MRYITTSEQLYHLKKEGFIEIQAFFNTADAELIKELLEKALIKNKTGRDLHAENFFLSKALQFSKWGQIASGFYGHKRIKLAFTQYFPCYGKQASIEEISSISEVYGGALLHLSKFPITTPSYLPKEMGDATFYTPSFSLDFAQITYPALLLVFTTENARYKLQEQDPHTHLLKRAGYAFGDTLSNMTHPLLMKN